MKSSSIFEIQYIFFICRLLFLRINEKFQLWFYFYSLLQSYGHCYKSTPNNKTRIIPTVVLPFYEPRLIGVGISKEELAGALFKQLGTVFLQIKEELFQRKKCLT